MIYKSLEFGFVWVFLGVALFTNSGGEIKIKIDSINLWHFKTKMVFFFT